MTMHHSAGKERDVFGPRAPGPVAAVYFILTVLGFSFWFFMAVPFASHRETYSWLAEVQTQGFFHAFKFISSTYRPLAQVMTWLGFEILDPRIFPTSIYRQALLQGFIYAMFVLAWWLIYSTVVQRRVFALLACAAGAVFFSGYVHLFHIYGIYYVAVMLTLGALLRSYASHTFAKRERWFALAAILLTLWHPFATALFLGFYFGFYLETFRERSRGQHVQAIAIMAISFLAILALVVIFPRTKMPMDNRLFGFLVSYRTSEINVAGAAVAFIMTLLTLFSMRLSARMAVAAVVVVSGLAYFLISKDLPLLFLWPCAALVKLFRLRCWSLFFLGLAATLLPLGGAIGTPIYTLFAIIVSLYAMQLGWIEAEQALSFMTPRYVAAMVVVLASILLLVRTGTNVPLVTGVSVPLLRERERTYQLENVLTWLHNSDYCGYEIAFLDNAGSPVESVESAITRRNRPPAALEDVQLYWKTVLQCQQPRESRSKALAIVTFGGSQLAELRPVFKVSGRYSGEAAVWIGDSGK